MKPVRPVLLVAPRVMFLASCTAGPPTGIANQPLSAAVKQAQPRPISPPMLRCSRSLPTVSPGSDRTGSALVPAGSTKAVLCVYAGGNNRRFGFGALMGSVVVPVPSALAWAIDESAPAPTGATACPSDGGQVDVAVFANQGWTIARVSLALGGCRRTASSRAAGVYWMSPDAEAMVRALDGALRDSTRRAGGS